MRTKNNKRIAVVCYDRVEYWNSRKMAAKFYLDGAMACDGCESDRYMNIYLDLIDGNTLCEDGYSDSYEFLVSLGRVGHFNNPNDTRDYRGTVYFPLPSLNV